jgi:hypothetical protein
MSSRREFLKTASSAVLAAGVGATSLILPRTAKADYIDGTTLISTSTQINPNIALMHTALGSDDPRWVPAYGIGPYLIDSNGVPIMVQTGTAVYTDTRQAAQAWYQAQVNEYSQQAYYQSVGLVSPPQSSYDLVPQTIDTSQPWRTTKSWIWQGYNVLTIQGMFDTAMTGVGMLSDYINENPTWYGVAGISVGVVLALLAVGDVTTVNALLFAAGATLVTFGTWYLAYQGIAHMIREAQTYPSETSPILNFMYGTQLPGTPLINCTPYQQATGSC